MRSAGQRRASATVLSLLAIVFAAQLGSAYIDAGSGSYIFQLLVGAFVGIAVTIGTFWRRIWSFLGSRRARKG